MWTSTTSCSWLTNPAQIQTATSFRRGLAPNGILQGATFGWAVSSAHGRSYIWSLGLYGMAAYVKWALYEEAQSAALSYGMLLPKINMPPQWLLGPPTA